MSIKIIGAGMPRTGTTTLKGCLETLGFKHVYHMKELLVKPEMLHYWKTLDDTGNTDWDSLYAGFDATVDFPGQKLKMMGKLLLSARARKVVKCIKWFKDKFFARELEGRFEDKAFAEAKWNSHIEEVKKYVPKDKLLVYDVRDGWEPLCAFLGVPVPDVELPHLNKKENFKEMLPKLMKGEMA